METVNNEDVDNGTVDNEGNGTADNEGNWIVDNEDVDKETVDNEDVDKGTPDNEAIDNESVGDGTVYGEAVELERLGKSDTEDVSDIDEDGKTIIKNHDEHDSNIDDGDSCDATNEQASKSI